jgi:hypothetical protein
MKQLKVYDQLSGEYVPAPILNPNTQEFTPGKIFTLQDASNKLVGRVVNETWALGGQPTSHTNDEALREIKLVEQPKDRDIRGIHIDALTDSGFLSHSA